MCESETVDRQFVSDFPSPTETDSVRYDPSIDELRNLAGDAETTTDFGSPSYVSRDRSRKADRTANEIDNSFGAADYEIVSEAIERVTETDVVCLDRQVGRKADHTYVCRYYVPTAYARIALSLAKLLEPAPEGASPDFHTVQLPEWEETAIRVLPERGLTVVAGSDYTGEAKKSFLRLFMHREKQRGGLGLHAGSKRVEFVGEDGHETVGQLFLGLSGTGKSTLTAHDLGLEEPEEATMLQDDVCALRPDGTVVGSEGEGLFVKTHGLDPGTEPAMYDAVTHPSAVLENVDVDDDGTVDFDSDRYTENGRAIIQRDHLSSADAKIDLPTVDQIFFITRNPAMPAIARLSPTGAAAAFMLGESIETSAGDPATAGESVRVVGTNPFIVGPPGEEGNRFRELIADLDIECYALNTGRVGTLDVSVEDTVAILHAVSRGEVTWRTDGVTELTVPVEVDGVDASKFDVATTLPNPTATLRSLRAEREAYLDRFDTLDPVIRNARY